jgi:L-amino acid N-acyltransferase YncA
MTEFHVRAATVSDAAACAAIYAPYVHDTAITFELDPPDDAEMADRIAAAAAGHAWLVLEDPGGRATPSEVVGYAYGSQFKSRAAYRWSCEVSVYLRVGLRRSGAGRALYSVLLPILADRGFRVAVAGMTLPNEASAGLHRAMGFEPVGVHRNIGWKLGAWHDVALMQRPLREPGEGGDERDPPRDLS